MARKKGVRNLTAQEKRQITADYIAQDSVQSVAKKHNLAEDTIRKIVYKNVELQSDIKDRLTDSLIVGAGKVGNLAINALEKKNLNKEKASTCSQIASDMSKIIRGDQPAAVQVNITMPRSRAELIEFLKNDKVVDIPTNSESASIEGKETIIQEPDIPKEDKPLNNELKDE